MKLYTRLIGSKKHHGNQEPPINGSSMNQAWSQNPRRKKLWSIKFVGPSYFDL